MADLSITISNSITVHGGGKTSKWNAFNWGESNWGPNEIVRSLIKVLSNTLTLTDSIGRTYSKGINETLTIETDQTNGSLTSGDWNYVFPPDTIVNDEKISTSYTTSTESSASYSEITYTTSTWT